MAVCEAVTAERAFGEVLRALRHERGLSQERLGFETGYHRTYISLLERGLKSPSLNTVLRVAAVLQVPASEMVRRVEAMIGTSSMTTRNRRRGA